MPLRLVECIPNFSEGRRMDVVDAIVSAIQSVPSILLLDQTSDPDHHRSVVTFAGTPEAVVEAAFRSIREASQRIDLTQQSGQHPRIGSADVVPFVPLEGVTLEECAALARQLGKRVGEELGLPVYLYEAAATRPERADLAVIRHGGYEVLREAIVSDPDRQPDFGPASLGTAGAVVIGARRALIAFNVYLKTDDVRIARKIAKTIRASSGGFPFLKALGLLVGGRAQVSMNFTDYTQTPLVPVIDAIRREAATFDVEIERSELIGLIPQQALNDAAAAGLHLDFITQDQVLESRLAKLQSSQGNFLNQLAAGTAAPAGGSALAYSAAMAAALAGMSARLTFGKKKYADVQARMEQIALEADTLRSELEHAVQADAAAFTIVMQAYTLPKATTEDQNRRTEAIDTAMLKAVALSMHVVQNTVRIMDLLAELAEKGNINTVADAYAGLSLAQAALQATSLNIRSNVAAITHHQQPMQQELQRLAELNVRAREFEVRVRRAVHERTHLTVE